MCGGGPRLVLKFTMCWKILTIINDYRDESN